MAKIGTACTTASPCVTTADTCTADIGSVCACATGLVANGDKTACCKYSSQHTRKIIAGLQIEMAFDQLTQETATFVLSNSGQYSSLLLAYSFEQVADRCFYRRLL